MYAIVPNTKPIISKQIERKSTNKSSDLSKFNLTNTQSDSTTNLSLPGIVNHGNTCYINSIIQCLNCIDTFVQYFVLDKYKSYALTFFNTQGESQMKSDNMSLLLSFSSLLKSLWQKDLNCDISSKDFKTKLALTEQSFRSNDQQDAQEFLLYLLNNCHESLKLLSIDNTDYSHEYDSCKISKYNFSSDTENISHQNTSIIQKLFVTHQKLTIICPGCGHYQYKSEPYLCLSLPVPAKTMEPLYYCFIKKDGSQIFSAIWINTISLVQYVRADIAHKFCIDIDKVIIMSIHESGFGKYFQDSEQAFNLVLPDNCSGSVKNLWNGVVVLNITSATSKLSCLNPIKQIKRIDLMSIGGTSRYSGTSDNIIVNESDTQSTRKFSILQNNDFYDNNNNSSNNIPEKTELLINLFVMHVEEIFEKSNVRSWRRFSAPVSLLIPKEIEFKELEEMIINQLERVYSCQIQYKLNDHLRFRVWDGSSNTDVDIKIDHQFPMLTEAVESIASLSNGIIVIRMICIWSANNVSKLIHAVFSNLRLSHSLSSEFLKIDHYNGENNTQSLSLMDKWPPIEENDSVERVMRESLLRSDRSDSKGISLEDCIKAYLSEEILDDKDAWKCSNCQKFQRATISNSIYSLPYTLILHLKRFQSYSSSFHCEQFRDNVETTLPTVASNNNHSYNDSFYLDNNSNNKLNILVDYPLSGLDMKVYLSADAIKNSKKIDSNEYYYDLVAVCNHQGTLSSGHYTAFCRSSIDFKWRLFNDDVVKEVSSDKVIQPLAYILFYQRRSSIVCHNQHWSVLLNTKTPGDYMKSTSPQSLKATTNLCSKKHTNSNNISDLKQKQLKSDPRKKVILNKMKTSNDILRHSSLHRPLPLSNACAHIVNIATLDNSDDEDSDDRSSQGSTSYDEYIPASVTKRPLKLPTQVRNNNSRLNFSKPH